MAGLAKTAGRSDRRDRYTVASAQNWVHARRSGLYRPLKQPAMIRLDADVSARFKEHAAEGGCPTEIKSRAATASGRCGEASRLGYCSRSDGLREAVIFADVAGEGASSASGLRFSEFYADRMLAPPNHVDFA